ncbi:40S ribosomal protein S13 [Sesamum angolense]|uniref:40S ribosomal protein S13 n=1 Tax=Sesamum angolense TaxID=2727404 RepID=A0AAE1TB21_9LAMI|nr:40S ribosomal protein S13 [Sesamum angolense]
MASHGGAICKLSPILENGAEAAPWRAINNYAYIHDQFLCFVEDNICKFAKKGLTPSQIGVILRDSHGIAQVKSVTGSKILRILKAHGLAPEIPEDLYHLIKKAVAIRKHLERNRKDKDSKFRLILVESRIHRLARYYKKTKKLHLLIDPLLGRKSALTSSLEWNSFTLVFSIPTLGSDLVSLAVSDFYNEARIGMVFMSS